MTRAAVRPPEEVTAPPGTNNLPRSGKLLVGRAQETSELEAFLRDGSPGSCLVIHGLGGAGKSSLVLHHIRQRTRSIPPQTPLVWWITADSKERIDADLADLAGRLEPVLLKTPETMSEATAWAHSWLQSHDDWILVFDNAEDPALLDPLIGSLSRGRHLITSRRSTGWHHAASTLALGMLKDDEAVTLLTEIAPHVRQKEPDRPDTAAQELVVELGCLPLAVEQVAAYLAETGSLPSAYLALLRTDPGRAVRTAPHDFDSTRTIDRVWQLTMESVAARSLMAAHAMRVLAWYAPDRIPRHVLSELSRNDPLAIDAALGVLAAYSMIRVTPQYVSVHRIVQTVTRTAVARDPQRTHELIVDAATTALTALQATLPDDDYEAAQWADWRPYLPHVAALIHNRVISEERPEESAAVLHGAGLAVAALTQGKEAIRYLKTALHLRQHHRGHTHLLTLRTHQALAFAYQYCGDPQDALPHHRHAVEISSQVLGDDHPDTLQARAGLLAMEGKECAYDMPPELVASSEQLLRDVEDTLGARSWLTAVVRANAGVIRLGVALPLGAEDPDPDDVKAALQHLERAVSSFRDLAGPGYLYTLFTEANLGLAMILDARFTEGLAVIKRAVDALSEDFGEDDPDVAFARLYQALAHIGLEEGKSALELLDRCIHTALRTFEHDPRMYGLILTLHATAMVMAQEHERARPALEEAMRTMSDCLPVDNPDLLQLRVIAALNDWLSGSLLEAVRQLKKVYLDAERALGPDHVTAVTARKVLRFCAPWFTAKVWLRRRSQRRDS
ncbi:tetratricopeptide repeat protein [Streptomyces rochei]|nr:tetratricopeptide repeat protein [Streptomyces rochei]WQC17372.1 tetratricopeptide repeat protein [Streptomyces rochei]